MSGGAAKKKPELSRSAKGCLGCSTIVVAMGAVMIASIPSTPKPAPPPPPPKKAVVAPDSVPGKPESPTPRDWANYKAPTEAVSALVATRDTSVLASPGGERLGKLKAGHAMKYVGPAGEYHLVYGFSGEHRYIRAQDGRPEKKLPKVPAEASARAAFAALLSAEDQANRLIDGVADIKAAATLQRMAVDKVKLQACLELSISPLDADQVEALGVMEQWPPLGSR